MYTLVRLLLMVLGLLLLGSPDSNTVITGAIVFLFGLAAPIFIINLGYIKRRASPINSHVDKKSSNHAHENKSNQQASSWQQTMKPPLIVQMRRIFFWFLSGSLMFFMYYSFVLVRWIVVDDGYPSLLNYMRTPDFGIKTLTVFFIVIVSSLVAGYVLHLFYYYGTAIHTLSPIQTSLLDRAYQTLVSLKQDYKLDYSYICTNEKRCVEDTTFPMESTWYSSFFGPISYKTPENYRQLQIRARRNWVIFDVLWGELIPPSRYLAVESMARYKEDIYALFGVARISNFLGWVVFVGYEWLRLREGVIDLFQVIALILLTLALHQVVFIIIGHFREVAGRVSIEYKESQLRIFLEELRLKFLSGKGKKGSLPKNWYVTWRVREILGS